MINTKISEEISAINDLLHETKPFRQQNGSDEVSFCVKIVSANTIHSFYNGLELIFIELLSIIDESKPSGSHWHKKLFDSMFGYNSRNIVLIRTDIKKQLYECLIFRHLFRNIYCNKLDWNRIKPIIHNLDEVWNMIKFDIETFINLDKI